MVDLAQVPSASMLVQEYRAVRDALKNLDAGGRIVSMSIAPPMPEQPEGAPEPPLSLGVQVPTRAIDIPPPMVESIATALEQRLEALADELTELGVTGFEQLAPRQTLKKGAK